MFDICVTGIKAEGEEEKVGCEDLMWETLDNSEKVCPKGLALNDSGNCEPVSCEAKPCAVDTERCIDLDYCYDNRPDSSWIDNHDCKDVDSEKACKNALDIGGCNPSNLLFDAFSKTC